MLWTRFTMAIGQTIQEERSVLDTYLILIYFVVKSQMRSNSRMLFFHLVHKSTQI